MEEKVADHKKIKQDIINKAEIDSKFCDELKKNPKGAIHKHFPQADGSTIPAEMNVVVVEDSENTVFINIDPGGTVKSGY